MGRRLQHLNDSLTALREDIATGVGLGLAAAATGESGAPLSTPDHAPYSMREIARDQVEVMHTPGMRDAQDAVPGNRTRDRRHSPWHRYA